MFALRGLSRARIFITIFYSQFSNCHAPLQVLRQRQLSHGGGMVGSNTIYGNPITTSSSWPSNPIHIKQEIQIPQVGTFEL
jgi:hypothetical protein